MHSNGFWTISYLEMMADVTRSMAGRPRWQWSALGGGRLFGPDGTEYWSSDSLERIEIERLLKLNELDLVVIKCGNGIARWVSPQEAHDVWKEVEPYLDEGDWRPPPGESTVLPYIAELWRSSEGRHLILFTNE